MKKIKRISLLKNVVMCDDKTNKKTLNKDGVMLVEYSDNTRNMLDMESKTDITNKKNIKVGIVKELFFKTKMVDLFVESR